MNRDLKQKSELWDHVQKEKARARLTRVNKACREEVWWRPAACWTVDFSLQLLAMSVICVEFESTSGEVEQTQLSEPPTERRRWRGRSLHTQLGVTGVTNLWRTTHWLIMYFQHIAVFLVEEMHYRASAFCNHIIVSCNGVVLDIKVPLLSLHCIYWSYQQVMTHITCTAL